MMVMANKYYVESCSPRQKSRYKQTDVDFHKACNKLVFETNGHAFVVERS